MERVYVETTFVSYLTARPGRDLSVAGHQQITHDWWEIRRANYELVVSQLVLEESGDGDPQVVCSQNGDAAHRLNSSWIFDKWGAKRTGATRRRGSLFKRNQ